MSDKNETKVALKDYDLSKVTEVNQMAHVLRAQIAKHKLYTNIKGKNYVHVDGWEFAGGMLGILPRVVEMTDLSSKDGKEVKWMAKVEIIDKNDRVISRGFAICSNKEDKKKSFDEYAVMSMAQTRAIGKAYRNVLAWVMKLAGYEGTTSEEMHKGNVMPAEPTVEADASPRASYEEAIKKLRSCRSVDGLNAAWRSLSASQRNDDEVVEVAKEMRNKLKK